MNEIWDVIGTKFSKWQDKQSGEWKEGTRLYLSRLPNDYESVEGYITDSVFVSPDKCDSYPSIDDQVTLVYDRYGKFKYVQVV